MGRDRVSSAQIRAVIDFSLSPVWVVMDFTLPPVWAKSIVSMGRDRLQSTASMGRDRVSAAEIWAVIDFSLASMSDNGLHSATSVGQVHR